MYRIEFDDHERIMAVVLKGFWDVETTKRFLAELGATSSRLRAEGERYDVIVYNTDRPAQAAEVMDLLDTHLKNYTPPPGGGRLAIVVSSALAKLQTQRLFRSPSCRAFTARDEALRWLAEDRTGD